MDKFLNDCLGSRTLKWLAAGALAFLALGLLTWGLAPKLLLSTLPLLGIVVCLVPCLLPLLWLRRSLPPAAPPSAAHRRKLNAPGCNLPEIHRAP